MKINKEDVKHVAQLARLRFRENELEQFTHQLDAILTYMDQLNELDTSSVEPTTHAMDLFNVFREDRVVPSMTVEEALSNAPQRMGGAFQVPRVIE
ncbi:MAG: Asp-tRNA(Asn)/Glu-tRNA(Gln) amidotransferase subunit GatC [Thermodesulfobacteriota bacterium]